jgi:hypothetical protein
MGGMMDIKYEVNKIKEKLMMWVAWKMPRWLVMWCAVRLGANATQGKYDTTIVPDLLFMDALRRWEK